MRKVLGYSFILIVLLHITPLQQLFKLPVLLEHFAEHRELNPDISFFHFMSMHYFGDDEPDNDYERDMQLPFKKVGNPQSQYEVYTPPVAGITFPVMITWTVSSAYPSLQHNQLPDSYKGSLFKPPRA